MASMKFFMLEVESSDPKTIKMALKAFAKIVNASDEERDGVQNVVRREPSKPPTKRIDR